jgi:hypothetical protein
VAYLGRQSSLALEHWCVAGMYIQGLGILHHHVGRLQPHTRTFCALLGRPLQHKDGTPRLSWVKASWELLRPRKEVQAISECATMLRRPSGCVFTVSASSVRLEQHLALVGNPSSQLGFLSLPDLYLGAVDLCCKSTGRMSKRRPREEACQICQHYHDVSQFGMPQAFLDVF